jgi:sulfur carrier protein ThiS adenylyltransferase
MPGWNILEDNPPELAEVLAEASVGIAGAGGIGSNVAMMLARAGVGRLVVVDHDSVEPRNLNRQCYFADQAGMPKVTALADLIARTGSPTSVVAVVERLSPGRCLAPFEGCGVLVEALDLDEAKVMLLEEWLGAPWRPRVVAVSGIAGWRSPESLGFDRRRGMTLVGDGTSSLDSGTYPARVVLAAALVASEVTRLLAGAPVEESEGVSLRIGGRAIPLSGYPGRVLVSVLEGLLSTLHGYSSVGAVSLEIPGTVRSPGGPGLPTVSDR